MKETNLVENFLVLHLTNRRVRNMLYRLGALLEEKNMFLKGRAGLVKVSLGPRWLNFLNFYFSLAQFYL
jgi:hypothetical protein